VKSQWSPTAASRSGLQHRRSQGGQRGHGPPKFLENTVILCFEQNSVIRLKSNVLAPPNFWAGYATGLQPLRIPSVNGDPPKAPHFCFCRHMNWWVVVRQVQLRVSIWDAGDSNLVDMWALFAKWYKVSAIHERALQRYSEVFGLRAKGQGFIIEADYQLKLSFLVVEVDDCRHRFVVLSFTSRSGGIHLQSPCLCLAPLPLLASLHQHAWLLDCRRLHTFWRRRLASQRCRCYRRSAKTDPCGTQFLRRRNLLHLFLAVVRVKLQLSAIPWSSGPCAMSGSNRSKLQMRPRCGSVVGCCGIDKHSFGLLLCRKAILDVPCQQGHLIYTVDHPCRKPGCSCGCNVSMTGVPEPSLWRIK